MGVQASLLAARASQQGKAGEAQAVWVVEVRTVLQAVARLS